MAKVRGKEWYEIQIPEFLGNMIIGETPAIEPEKLKGRTIEMSLMDLSGDASKYHIKLFFRINEIKGNKALTEYFGHDCTRDFIARIVQKRTTRIDTNEVIKFEDGKMRIKSIAISNKNLSNKLKKEIGKMIRNMIREELKGMEINKFIKNMILGKIQNKIKREVSKIYPLRFFEFRKTEVNPQTA